MLKTMLTDTQLLLTIIILSVFIVSAVIIAGILFLQRILDSEHVHKIFHEGSPAEQFTRLTLLAIVLLLSFISYLLYDHTVLLPQRVARAAQEAKKVSDRADVDRWFSAFRAESAAIGAQIEQSIKDIDAYCKKHPSDIAICGAPKHKQEKKP